MMAMLSLPSSRVEKFAFCINVTVYLLVVFTFLGIVFEFLFQDNTYKEQDRTCFL